MSSSSNSDSSINVVDNSDHDKKGKKVKRSKKKSTPECKSLQPTIDVLTFCNIIDRSTIIKNDICNKLKIDTSNFSNVTKQQIASCSSLTKPVIAEHLLNVVNLCDAISRSSIQLSKPSQNISELSSIELNIKKTISNELQELNKSNEFLFESINDEIKKLQSLTAEVSKPTVGSQNSRKLHQVPPAPEPDTVFIKADSYSKISNVFVTEDMKSKITDIMEEKTADFTMIGKRSVLYFGEHEYAYSGTTHPALEPPGPIDEIIKMINQDFPDKPVNSCLVTQYNDGNCCIPLHSDNEQMINPESNIYTLSLGAERTMSFHNRKTQEVSSIPLPDRSLLCFSRFSQDLWEHEIPADATCKCARTSLTFRDIAPHYLNATVICGDSNTKNLAFGTDHNTFGTWLPGKHIEAYEIDQIPGPGQIGPYPNVVIHVGVNDIKHNNSKPIPDIAFELEKKCKLIHDVYPNTKIHLSPLLPTKSHSINQRVSEMNWCIRKLSQKHRNLCLMPSYHNLLAYSDGTLKSVFGVYRQGKPFDQDVLHLGRSGLTIFAKCIKYSILNIDKRMTMNTNIDKNVNTNIRHQSIGGNRSPQSRNYARALNHNLRS